MYSLGAHHQARQESISVDRLGRPSQIGGRQMVPAAVESDFEKMKMGTFLTNPYHGMTWE
jgi:hypothetical protein